MSLVNVFFHVVINALINVENSVRALTALLKLKKIRVVGTTGFFAFALKMSLSLFVQIHASEF